MITIRSHDLTKLLARANRFSRRWWRMTRLNRHGGVWSLALTVV